MINMGHGSFRNISMGNVNIKKASFIGVLWQNKDINFIFSMEMKDANFK